MIYDVRMKIIKNRIVKNDKEFMDFLADALECKTWAETWTIKEVKDYCEKNNLTWPNEYPCFTSFSCWREEVDDVGFGFERKMEIKIVYRHDLQKEIDNATKQLRQLNGQGRRMKYKVTIYVRDIDNNCQTWDSIVEANCKNEIFTNLLEKGFWVDLFGGKTVFYPPNSVIKVAVE